MYGLLFGSFANVCIYRIPKGESIVINQSHCMTCKKKIKWYDLIPLFSYIFLRAKCRNCNKKISIQYPLIELLNALLYVITFMILGLNPITILYCFVITALLVLSVIDFRTYTINIWINVFILFMGIIKFVILISQSDDFGPIVSDYILGLFIVSGFLLILYLITSGRAIGMGDINLMGAAGFFLGWKLIILAFLLGSIIGAVIHSIRVRFFNHDRMLAFGPYLSIGIMIAILFGDNILKWYITYFIK